ncbi:MAG: TolC family protein [Hymenobacter sp.]
MRVSAGVFGLRQLQLGVPEQPGERAVSTTRFPNSYAGVQLGLPLFTGFRRTQNLRQARLLDQRIDEDLLGTRNQITAEYTTALG